MLFRCFSLSGMPSRRACNQLLGSLFHVPSGGLTSGTSCRSLIHGMSSFKSRVKSGGFQNGSWGRAWEMREGLRVGRRGYKREYSAAGATAGDPYRLLGVEKGASDQEIKLAYLRKAKECHPDLHPGDKRATARFQELSAAYQRVRDADARREDLHTSRQQHYSQQHRRGGHPSAAESEEEAKHVFDSVLHDLNMIYEVVDWTIDEFKADMVELSAAYREGNMARVRQILSDYKLAGALLVVVPLLILPGPRMAMMALKVALSRMTILAMLNPRIGTTLLAELWKGMRTRVLHRRAELQQRRPINRDE